jgi:hypothetical protein
MVSGFRPHIAIDCMLSPGDEGLKGDGCIYEMSAAEPHLISPDTLKAGEYVKLRLWLPDESSYILIDVAEIQWIEQNWIKVDVLIISQTSQNRLKEFLTSRGRYTRPIQRLSEQILIRA